MSVMQTYKRFDLNFVQGEGVYLTEKSGEKYLDFVAGIAVNALGHSHPVILKAIEEQSKKLIHISNLYHDDNQIALAQKLVSLGDHHSVFFTNSGTEAIEGALKVARKYGREQGKSKILYMSESFHGRTMGALAVTGQSKYQEPFAPLIGDVQQVVFNDKEDFLAKMDEGVCGVIIEPVQGEGGINPVDPDFLNCIREACDKQDALLIFDEVQAGIGRTGSFFAYQGFDVIPDVIAMAKGLGGGVPIGALMVNKKADVLTFGDHGCTFGGNPLVTAVSNAVVDTVSNEEFLKEVKAKGEYFKEKLLPLVEEYDFIKGIKGRGLMIGVSIDTEKMAPGTIVAEAIKHKLLIVGAGKDTLRLVPPLVVTTGEIDEFMVKFKSTLEALKK
ncbi:MAG: acetylornithine aminotransferase [delta proteobacterium ML8_F1]|nr:MAG: acetylornithine aminotransferase [delta proteobacterium ML8_F1]